MSRLQKKCFVASTTMHVLLMSVLFVSPAFLSKEKNFEEIPVITLIPTKLIDDPAVGGGGGQKAPAATPKPAEVLPPAPQPPAIPKERVAQPPPEPTPAQPESELSAKDKTVRDRADAAAKAKQQAQLVAALDRVRQGLDKNLSSQTTGIDMPDLGGVGEAYANWAWVVKKIYEDAWTPDDVADNDSTVKVSVTIQRSGRVRNSYILQKSGSSDLDRSVSRALDKVKSVPEFPEGAKEYERTLKLNFNLKSKRLSG
jgi:TonB family protein